MDPTAGGKKTDGSDGWRRAHLPRAVLGLRLVGAVLGLRHLALCGEQRIEVRHLSLAPPQLLPHRPAL
eukprot:685554-Pyramimonas_sp.AAC.1